MRCLAAVFLAASFLVCRPVTAADNWIEEFYNEGTKHYVLLADPEEIAGVDAGKAGPGWRRTGYRFYGEFPVFGRPVCRFYAASVNSHFFTGDATECEFLRTHDTGWSYEGIAFWADVPVAGACATGLSPVFRLYNGRARFHDTNHRFTPDPAVRARQLAAGWIDEGIAFCTYTWADKSFVLGYSGIRESISLRADCLEMPAPYGNCIALFNLPPMNRVVFREWRTIIFGNVTNPDYPVAADDLVGAKIGNQLWASDPASTIQPVTAHSFVQSDPGTGVYLESRDRTSGPYSSIEPSYRFAPFASDDNVYSFRPWGDGRDHNLVLSFNLVVKTLRRGDDASHAYGHPVIDFLDRRSARRFHVAIGTYGTLQPNDLLARDVTSGQVIVSTVFREAPAFGRVLAGRWIGCGDCAPATDFKFVLNRAEFAQALALARRLEPDLSTDPADYLVASFRFKNEAYGDAQIGVALTRFMLESYFTE